MNDKYNDMKKEFHLMHLRSQGHKKLLEDLNLYIQDLINQNKLLQEKLNNYNKDEEIQKLKNEINELRTKSIHIMNEKEREEAKEFSEEHYNSCKSNIQYILEGTGIGTAIMVKCKKCGTVKNITDFEKW